MRYSGTQIAGRIRWRIRRAGGAYKKWVVGTSSKPSTKLFSDHGVRRKGDFWIFMRAESAAVARKVCAFLVKKRGLLGPSESGDPAAQFVYAYQKSAHTTP